MRSRKVKQLLLQIIRKVKHPTPISLLVAAETDVLIQIVFRIQLLKLVSDGYHNNNSNVNNNDYIAVICVGGVVVDSGDDDVDDNNINDDVDDNNIDFSNKPLT